MYLVDLDKFKPIEKEFLVPLYLGKGIFSPKDSHPLFTLDSKIYVLTHTKQKGKRLNLRIRLKDIEGEYCTGIKHKGKEIQYLTTPLLTPRKINNKILGYIMIKPYLYELNLTIEKFKLLNYEKQI
jgi:hypothetical protein